MFDRILEWLKSHPGLIQGMVIFSAAMIVAALLLVPRLVARIPPDYFNHESRERTGPRRHPILHALLLVLKNLVGLVLLLAGIAMLVLPGQGLLTMLAGLMLMDFPGKYRLERWFVRRPAVLKGLNWMRKKGGAPPLEVD